MDEKCETHDCEGKGTEMIGERHLCVEHAKVLRMAVVFAKWYAPKEEEWINS